MSNSGHPLLSRPPWRRGSRLSVFAADVMAALRAVPRGRVATYGQVAWVAGHPGAARQVAWILHSSSKAYRLPWHRIIGAKGTISLKRGRGFETQATLLKKEGVRVDPAGRVDLKRYLWESGPIVSERALCYKRTERRPR